MPTSDHKDLDAQLVEDMARRLHRLASNLPNVAMGGILLLVPSVRADAFRAWESLPERTREWYRDDARRALSKGR